MVVKIYAAAPSCSSAVQYNERKVTEGHASVLFSSGMYDPSRPMDTFSVYERGSLRCQNMSFHASVNPGKDDGMTDEKVKNFVKDYMERMGYGKQPWILYKHTDLERIHYHIVSVRVDKDGKKISDSYERKKSQEALKELAEAYGYTVGKKKDMDAVPELEEEKKSDLAEDFNPYDGFNPEKGDSGEQMEAIIDLVMSYHFTQPEHFDLIMEDLGVRVVRGNFEEHEWIQLQGLDPKTKEPCTPLMSPLDEYYDLPDMVAIHANQCKGQIKTREKEKVSNIARAALKVSKSQKHFENYLKKSGIKVVISRNVNNHIFGAVFIDHKNKCVFKASELPKFSAKMIEDARQNKWYGEDNEKERNDQSRTAAEEAADLLISALGAEKSRRHEDEEIMRRGRKGPN